MYQIKTFLYLCRYIAARKWILSKFSSPPVYSFVPFVLVFAWDELLSPFFFCYSFVRLAKNRGKGRAQGTTLHSIFASGELLIWKYLFQVVCLRKEVASRWSLSPFLNKCSLFHSLHQECVMTQRKYALKKETRIGWRWSFEASVQMQLKRSHSFLDLIVLYRVSHFILFFLPFHSSQIALDRLKGNFFCISYG